MQRQARPTVVIYTHSLLGGSMTFIKAHGDALVRYRPVYVGAHRESGIELPAQDVAVVNAGSPLGALRELLFRNFGWAPTLTNRLKSTNATIVHAHFGTAGPAALAIAQAVDVPLVVTFHGFDATMSERAALRSRRGRELLKHKTRLAQHAGAFIAVSEFIRGRLVDQGYPERKIRLIRNGIDLNRFQISSEPEANIPIALFVGRFVEKKGAKFLVQAATILHQRGVKFRLVMIGAGPLETELRRMVTDARISCEFTGFLDLESVKEWLGRARVVAVPSVTADNGDSEGLPTILLEAQASGVPVVATRHSGIPEGVEDGVTAELVDEKDVSALAVALQSFLEFPAKAQSFGRAGRQFVEERFDIRMQILQLEALYDELRSDWSRPS